MSETPESPPMPALDEVEAQFKLEVKDAGSSDSVQQLRSSYLGPKGRLTLMLRSIGQLKKEDRRAFGQALNEVKGRVEGQLREIDRALGAAELEKKLRENRIDTTLPARTARFPGAVHPVNRIVREMVGIFERLGFRVATGPEVELDFFNFEALNFPANHPARDMQDTFFVRSPAHEEGQTVLRTHTSPVQVRTLKSLGAPLRIISPGRVYRCDDDASHSPMFHQVEGLCVDEGISMAHLLGVLTAFVHAMFGERKVRLRPSYFPFVEPGAEMDITCVFCDGEGCRVCKDTGWMEILGAGMVHPEVLKNAGVDPKKFSGFAFGIGVDRVAMNRWRIDDLGHLFKGDVRFLEQLSC